MKRLIGWINSHSLRGKIMMIVFIIIIAMGAATLLILNGTLYDKLKEDLIENRKQRLTQINRNIGTVLNQVAEDMVLIYEDVESQVVTSRNIMDQSTSFGIAFSEYYLTLTRSMRSYKYIHSMMLFTRLLSNACTCLTHTQ